MVHSSTNYEIEIYSEAEGGAFIRSNPKILVLYCKETIVTPNIESDIDPSGSGVYSIYQDETNFGKSGFYQVLMKNFTVSNIYCPMTRYELSSTTNISTLEGISSFDEISMEVLIDSIQSPMIYPDYYAITIPTGLIRDFEFAVYGQALGEVYNVS